MHQSSDNKPMSKKAPQIFKSVCDLLHFGTTGGETTSSFLSLKMEAGSRPFLLVGTNVYLKASLIFKKKHFTNPITPVRIGQ